MSPVFSVIFMLLALGISYTAADCLESVDGCGQCSENSTELCEHCKDGHRLDRDTNTCEECSPNCLTCDQTGRGLCDPIGCSPGFSFDNNTTTCYGCNQQNCILCDPTEPHNCKLCVEGFHLDATSFNCESCSSNCTNCDVNGAGFCDFNGCGVGTRYNKDLKLCEVCGGNCKGCDVAGIGHCDEGYCMDGTGYDSGTSSCLACTDPVCIDCFEDHAICALCDSGHVADTNGTCVAS